MKKRGQFGPVMIMAVFALLTDGSLFGAVPGSGTLTTLTPNVSWTGGPYTAVTADPALCTPLTCDNFSLTVNVPATYYATNPTYTVQIKLTWLDETNDFDMYIFDAQGNPVNSSGQGKTTFEYVDLGQLTTGTFQIQVVAFTTVNASYSGKASLSPPLPDQIRSVKYKTGNFTFTQPNRLTGPNWSVPVFGVQDLEPRSAFDPLGNIYVAGIEGTPGGTDVWKSQDGGATFTYLGQPDGGQSASTIAGRSPGIGGGDEDIAIGSGGRVYVSALFGIQEPMMINTCNSTNGGGTWVDNPNSENIPLDDRQWIAAYGENTVYLTFAQLGVLLVGTNSIFVMKSTDGGVTFPQITEVTTPEFGVVPEFQGNIAVDPRNGYIYTVFIGHPGNAVYVARSTNGGSSFILKPVHQSAEGASYANVFPIIAVDRGGNLHVVYSNGTNVFLASSADFGATWTEPLRVNNGPETKTALSPWVDAGDAGKVDIMWWATSSANSLAADAKWKVYFAQVQNALAKNPTVSQNAATGVFHTGPICVNGTGCADGTRNLAEYASTTIYRDGKAMIVYPDDQQTTNPLTYFIKQTGGPVALSASAMAPRLNPEREVGTSIPDRFALDQNYPNPFNPTTMIRYALPSDSHVRLEVYNTLGEQVASLVDMEQRAGTYSIPFDALRLSSGVYYYKLLAGSFIDVKRMMIVR